MHMKSHCVPCCRRSSNLHQLGNMPPRGLQPKLQCNASAGASISTMLCYPPGFEQVLFFAWSRPPMRASMLLRYSWQPHIVERSLKCSRHASIERSLLFLSMWFLYAFCTNSSSRGLCTVLFRFFSSAQVLQRLCWTLPTNLIMSDHLFSEQALKQFIPAFSDRVAPERSK